MRRRANHSVYRVPSHLRDQYVLVPNLGMDRLLAWAHSTPGVVGFDLNTPTIAFRAQGKDQQCTYSTTVRFKDESKALWDLSSRSEGGRK